jgi:chemotaxis-related protein WspD
MNHPPAGSPSPDAGPPIISGDCWNQIGSSGDRSCPELEAHIHCRNCPVFASAARTFFDRPAPEGYRAEWTRWLGGSGEHSGLSGGKTEGGDGDQASVLIFRLGREWLAFRTATVAEVALPQPVHRIPHRTNETLIGLVNLRGQLQLCVSLHGLLGIGPAQGPPARVHIGHHTSADGGKTETGNASHGDPPAAVGARLIVLRDRDRSEVWIFPSEEVLGVHRLPRDQVLSVSSSLANPEVSFSHAILRWQGRNVSFLDEQRIFAALRSLGK